MKRRPARKPVSRKSPAQGLARRLRTTAKQRGMTGAQRNARRAGKALWSLLEDPLPSVRQASAFSLTVLRDPTLVQGFISVLVGAPPRDIARALVALGEAGYLNAAPYLVDAFSRDDRVVSAGMARALGLLAHRPAAPLLIAALDDDFVPTEAAEALGRINASGAIPSLLRALSHRKDTVRAAAAYALGLLDSPGEAEAAHAREQLTALADDASQRVRVCAAVARFELGDPDAPTAIRAALG